MTDPLVRGWCPGAHRPMRSGDGLVVRVRPRLGRLSGAQLAGLAAAAARFGSGRVDLTGRANLQIRGVADDGHPALLDALSAHGLLDADEAAERRRNVVVTPFPDAAGETAALAAALDARLADLPPLPAKFGFAVDTGPVRRLADVPADIRIERAAEGGLLVRADGLGRGVAVGPDEAIAFVFGLARWFSVAGGMVAGRGRMADLVGRGVRPPAALAGDALPAVAAPPPVPGPADGGYLVGFAFGAASAADLATLAALGDVRVTPWRMLLVETAAAPPRRPGLLAADDPLLPVAACSGAPACPQAKGATRDLARRLAGLVAPGTRLHVSGCAKGCALAGTADVVLVATAAGWDVVRDGRPGDPPVARGLSAARLADPTVFRELVS